jgi:hypothetical protein
VGQDGEVARLQRGPGQAEQEDVLEHPAAESDPLDARPLMEPVSGVGDEVGHRDVEARRHRPDGTAVTCVVEDPAPHGRRIDLIAADGEAIRSS